MQFKEIDEEIKKNGIKCQKCGGELSASEPFNLMMATKIGRSIIVKLEDVPAALLVLEEL